MGHIRGIGFDFNGVLVPLGAEGQHAPAAKLAFEDLTIAKDDARYRLSDVVHDNAHLHGTDERSIIRYLLSVGGIVESDAPLDDPRIVEAATKKSEVYARFVARGLPAISGAIEMVHWATDYFGDGHVGLVSTSPLAEVEPFIRAHHLGFGSIVTKEDVGGRTKPHPYAYQLAAERLELEPHQLVAIEDSPGGLRAAKSAGWLAIGLTTYQTSDALAPHADIVTTYPELQDMLTRI